MCGRHAKGLRCAPMTRDYFDAELFVIGCITDPLICTGCPFSRRNGGDDPGEVGTPQLRFARRHGAACRIIEDKKRGACREKIADKLTVVNSEVSSASNSHCLSVGDVVLAAPGSIPITITGKARPACSSSTGVVSSPV
jgi:hypothetical protein